MNPGDKLFRQYADGLEQPGFRSPHFVGDIVVNEAGSLTYDFRGRQRSVVYRKSPVTGWSYVFGIVQPSVITSK